MRFKILIPQTVEIPAQVVERIFLLICEAEKEAGVTKDEPVHMSEILNHPHAYLNGVRIPPDWTWNREEENFITLKKIRAAKRKEGRRR